MTGPPPYHRRPLPFLEAAHDDTWPDWGTGRPRGGAPRDDHLGGFPATGFRGVWTVISQQTSFDWEPPRGPDGSGAGLAQPSVRVAR